MNLTETELTRDFVSPKYCKILAEFGLYENTLYQWKVYGDFAKIITTAFDYDDYYERAIRVTDSLNPPDMTLPAYKLKDVEHHIPKDYCLSFTKDYDYVLMPSSLWNVEGCSAIRMPDVFAKHLVDCLRNKIISLDKINIEHEKTV